MHDERSEVTNEVSDEMEEKDEGRMMK